MINPIPTAEKIIDNKTIPKSKINILIKIILKPCI